MFADFRVHGLNKSFFQCFHYRSTPTYGKRKMGFPKLGMHAGENGCYRGAPTTEAPIWFNSTSESEQVQRSKHRPFLKCKMLIPGSAIRCPVAGTPMKGSCMVPVIVYRATNGSSSPIRSWMSTCASGKASKRRNRTVSRSPTLVQYPDIRARLCRPNTVESTRSAFADLKNT